ncbi:hypothetical protein [Neobacillus niacini]|uniref:hypothetical protein n=1 Tax=Neobacillus niacini TaxID=86668 RepID=UPI0028544707|nr:hypothetical protein [Neobacillus niacini]MDR6997596.1 hypothetical protein [Neobacillus niacini]
MKKQLGNYPPFVITNSRVDGYSRTKKLVVGSILAAFATIFQSAGIFVGIGYAFSILATMPIVLSAMISIHLGIMSYFLTILLLLIIQPSEIFVFPFTTGLLGLSLGIAFRWWKSRIAITFFGGIILAAGILFLLYIVKFPVLGPSVSHTFHVRVVFVILMFSLFYSMVWMGLSRKVFELLFKISNKRANH